MENNFRKIYAVFDQNGGQKVMSLGVTLPKQMRNSTYVFKCTTLNVTRL